MFSINGLYDGQCRAVVIPQRQKAVGVLHVFLQNQTTLATNLSGPREGLKSYIVWVKDVH